MRGSAASTVGVGLQPRVQHMLAKQQFELAKNPANGIIFYQNEEGDVSDIQADIIGPVQTAYEGGIFRCKLVIESGFPQSAPKGFFLTKIFHPNVAQNTGEICVNTLKRDWNPAKWSLRNIFEVIKCLLIVPFPESSLNEEAGREFMDNYESFCEHASVYTRIHAKPNSAQRELISQRQKEEERQSLEQKANLAAGQPTLSTDQQPSFQPRTQSMATTRGLQENKNLARQTESLLPPSSLPTNSLQQLPVDVQMSSPEKSTGTQDEETKLAMMSEHQPYSGISGFQPVLSQLTNQQQVPHPGQHFNSIIMLPKDGCNPGISMSLKAAEKHMVSGSMVSAQLGQHNRLSMVEGDQQNVLIDTSSEVGRCSQANRPTLQRRQSVLYKKKAETAKQRQDRYIRRV